MNKLFTKIAGLSLGLAMAIGVGIAVGSNSKETKPVHAASGTFTKITSAPSDWSGEYVIVYESGSTAYCWTGVDAASCYATATISSGSITGPTNACTVTIETMTGGYSVKVNGGTNNGKYIANNGSSNGIKFNASASVTTLTYENNSVTMTCGGKKFRYNSASGQYRFRYFGSDQQVIQLYKKAASYTLSFNANGGSGTVPGNITGSGSKTLPSSASITKTGYTLDGWGDSSHKDNASAQYALGAAYTLSADITLYAHWTPNKYSVSASITYGTFTGATGANAATYGTAYNATISANTNYVLPDSLTVTMGGISTDAYTYNSSTGAFSIASPTGNISISGECVPDGGTEYVFSYELSHCSITDAPESMYDSQIKELQIVPDEHYKLPAEDANKVSVTGAVDWYYDEGDGTITIDGAEDDLTVTVECVAKAVNSISVTATNVTADGGNPTTVEEGATVTLTFIANEGYGLPASSGVTVTGTGSSSTWTQGTGKLQITGGTGNISVSITGIVRSVTSISLSSNSGSYALGDTFTMPTVTANYNVGASEDVTASATATGGGLENGVLTSTGTKTITISYGGQSATYTATVTAVVPSAGGIAKVTSTSDLTVGSTVYLVCEGRSKQLSGISTTSTKYGLGADYTTTPANTYPLTVCAGNGGTGYAFKNSSNNYLYWTTGNSLNQNSSLSNNTSWTVSFDDDGNATILNVADSNREIMWNYSSPRFACYSGQTPTYDTASGYNMVQIYKNYPAIEKALKWITAEVKSGTYYQGSDVTASDFTVTAHYDDGTTSTPTSDITVTNATLTVIGSNTVTLTYGGKSCNVTVIAVEQTAEYTGLSWSQGEYTIIDGHEIDFSKFGTVTAEYDDGDSYATKSIAACSVATYTKSGDVYTKVADLDDGDQIDSSSHGKYLGVTYTETNTYTAYSSAPIYVVESIEDVYTQVKTTSWDKVTSLNAGDKVTFVNETGAKVASGFDSNIITVSSYDSSVSTDFYFEVGKVGDYYTFHNANGYLGNHSTGTSGNNYAYLDAEIDEENNMNYFTVSFDEGNVVITSVYDSARKLQFNSTRFCFYGSNQSVVQLYKGTDGYTPSGESFANTNATVQKAVLQFAERFNDTMDCVNSGATTNVQSKWSTLSSDFTTAMSGFTGDDLAHFKALFANAYSVEDGDSLQDMLARYDYIIAKYKISNDFLHTGADRGAVSYSININPLQVSAKSAGTTIAIIAISAVSLAAIGGYFLFRKKKEN